MVEPCAGEAFVGAANGSERERRAGSVGSARGVDAGAAREIVPWSVPGGPKPQLGVPIRCEPLSADDLQFKTRVESGELPPADFSHRSHVRLAWVYLAGHDAEAAHAQMRATLLRFLERHGIPRHP